MVKVLAPLDENKQPVNIEADDFISLGRTIPIPANRSTAHLSLFPRACCGPGGRRAGRVRPVASARATDPRELPGRPARHGLPGGGDLPCLPGGGQRRIRRGRPLLRRWARRIDQRIAVSQAARSFVGRYFPGSTTSSPTVTTNVSFAPASGRPGRREALPSCSSWGGRSRVKACRCSCKLSPGCCESNRTRAWRWRGWRPSPLPCCVTLPAEVRERVTCLGRLSGDGLADAYRRAWLMIAPSLGQESFGIILAEAMGSGAPVVASEHRGLPRGGGGGGKTGAAGRCRRPRFRYVRNARAGGRDGRSCAGEG